MKTTKEAMVLDILEHNPNEELSLEVLCDTMVAEYSSVKWTMKSVSNAAYRNKAKGHPIEPLKEGRTLVGFRYNKPTVSTSEPSWQSLDAAVNRMSEITKPITNKDPDDIFGSIEPSEQWLDKSSDNVPIAKMSEPPTLNIPEATVEAVMHYIMACKPIEVSIDDIMNHFFIQEGQAVELLLEVGTTYSQINVAFTITAVAL